VTATALGLLLLALLAAVPWSDGAGARLRRIDASAVRAPIPRGTEAGDADPVEQAPGADRRHRPRAPDPEARSAPGRGGRGRPEPLGREAFERGAFGRGGLERGAPGAGVSAHGVPAPRTVDVLDLLATAVEAGVDLPRALRAVGAVLDGADGAALDRAATALLWGAPWDSAWEGAPDALRRALDPVERSWTTGSAAATVIRESSAVERRRWRRAGRAAAARLGVTVVLPLVLCFLSAFVLVGLVPVVVSLAGRAAG
jgi:hypothetical protein